jgi:hypothetical protein
MKYVALTLCTVATALLVLALAGVANQIGAGGRAIAPIQNALPLLSSQQITDQRDVRSALAALDKLPSARFLASSGAPADSVGSAQAMAVSDGTLFALSTQRTETPASPSRRSGTYVAPPSRPLPLPLPNVTVVLESGTSGKAVINGQLVHVGDPVGDGMVVKSINVDAVSFSSGKEVLEVRMPLARLRVLGAFPGSSKGN